MPSRVFLLLAVFLAAACSPPASDEAPALAAAEDQVVVQYDCIPNYANWGAVTALYEETTGVRVPPDMKGSSAAMAALETERESPQADTAYYSGAIGFEAARRGLHQPYKPAGWEQIPDALKDPDGLWWTVHTAAIAFIVNTSALGDVPVPRSYADLLKPEYEGLVAYDDPTWGGTSFTFVYGLNEVLGGGPDDFEPAQAEFARAYFRPVVTSALPPEIAGRFLPEEDYARVRNLSLADMAGASDTLKRAWQERIRRGGG